MAKETWILVGAAWLFGMACTAESSSPAEQKTPQRIAIAELKERLESGERFLLIDLREDAEIEADGAIAGAIHIPMGELEKRMQDIPKDVRLVFY